MQIIIHAVHLQILDLLKHSSIKSLILFDRVCSRLRSVTPRAGGSSAPPRARRSPSWTTSPPSRSWCPSWPSATPSTSVAISWSSYSRSTSLPATKNWSRTYTRLARDWRLTLLISRPTRSVRCARGAGGTGMPRLIGWVIYVMITTSSKPLRVTIPCCYNRCRPCCWNTIRINLGVLRLKPPTSSCWGISGTPCRTTRCSRTTRTRET